MGKVFVNSRKNRPVKELIIKERLIIAARVQTELFDTKSFMKKKNTLMFRTKPLPIVTHVLVSGNYSPL